MLKIENWRNVKDSQAIKEFEYEIKEHNSKSIVCMINGYIILEGSGMTSEIFFNSRKKSPPQGRHIIIIIIIIIIIENS